MVPSLHAQVASLPCTTSPLKVRPYLRGGRLYSNMDSDAPLWLAELVSFPQLPDVLPLRQSVKPVPLVHNLFLSADKVNYHQLLRQDEWRPPLDFPSAILTTTPRLPALCVHWNESRHPALVFCRSERMLLSLLMKRGAAGDTLQEGAFYAFAAEEAPSVPGPLNTYWTQLTQNS